MPYNVTVKEMLIKTCLIACNLKQAEIARTLNISEGQVSKLIKGTQNNERFNLLILSKLGLYLGMKVNI
ncbi:MAG: hypothetical protein R3Y28_07070 [Candidatus Gastranaerophilales bacterium]